MVASNGGSEKKLYLCKRKPTNDRPSAETENDRPSAETENDTLFIYRAMAKEKEDRRPLLRNLEEIQEQLLQQIKAEPDADDYPAANKLFHEAIDWCVFHNQRIQDFLARQTDSIAVSEYIEKYHLDKDVKTYGDQARLDDKVFVILFKDRLNVAVAHLQKGAELGLDEASQYAIDSLIRWFPHDYPTEYVSAAREIGAVIENHLSATTGRHTVQKASVIVNDIFQEADKITDQYDVFYNTDPYYRANGYLADYVYLRYLGHSAFG